MAEWWEEYTAQPAAQPASQDGNWWDAYAADFGNVESGAETRPDFSGVESGVILDPREVEERRLRRMIASGEIPLPIDPSAAPPPPRTRPERTGWDALSELADSPVSRAIQDNPLIRGFAGRVNEAAAGANLLTLMPIASAVDAVRGDNMATDFAGSMVQQPRERAAALMPSADASAGEKLISATGGLAFDLPSAMLIKPLQAANALPRFLAATDTAVVKQLLGDAFKEAAMTARVPATTAGLSTALSVIDSGGTPEEAIKAGLADAGGTVGNFVLPLNIAGGIASRGLQGAAVNVVGEAAQNTVTNQFLPDELQRPLYDPEQLGISAVLGAPMAIALGERAPRSAPQTRARELTNELTVDASRIRTPESDAVDAGRETARAIFAEADAAARPDPATIDPERKPEKTAPTRLAELEAKPEPTLFEREEMALLQEGKPFDRQALLADLESAPEPELIRNGTRVFYPGDVKAMRAKLAEAGLSEGMRMTGEDGSDAGLYFPARLRAEVDAVLRPKPAEQAQPEPVKEGELPYRELGIPPPRKPRNRVKSAADFDPNYHDIRDFIALHGGLDAKAFAAEFNSEVPSPAENFRFFGKPLFRKSGGLQPDQLRELLQETGFLNPDSMDGVARYTPQDAYDLVDRALDGNPVYHSDGVATQNAIQNYNNEYADLSRRQEYIDEHGATPELDEEFARRADAMDRGDFEPVFSKRAKDRTATPDMFGATQRAQTTPTPRPASGDLFGAPTSRERLDAAQRDSDARLTGPAVGMRQGDGELFAGRRPEQADIEAGDDYDTTPTDELRQTARLNGIKNTATMGRPRLLSELRGQDQARATRKQSGERAIAEWQDSVADLKGKQPWEMTQGEWTRARALVDRAVKGAKGLDMSGLDEAKRAFKDFFGYNQAPNGNARHEVAVLDALQDGKPVPERVRAEYRGNESDAFRYEPKHAQSMRDLLADAQELTDADFTDDAQRRKDAARDGRTGTGRTDMAAGDGELFAGTRPEQKVLRSQRPDTQGIEVDEAADLTPEELAAFNRQVDTGRGQRETPFNEGQRLPADTRQLRRPADAAATPERVGMVSARGDSNRQAPARQVSPAADAQPDLTGQPPKFGQWFRASKMKDEAAKPMEFHHATDADFEAFDPSRRGSATGFAPTGLGNWFSRDAGAIKGYGSKTLSGHLRLENPKVMDSHELPDLDTKADYEALAKKYKAEGHDGLYFPDSKQAVAFDSVQFKEKGNSGEYSESPNIFKSQRKIDPQTETPAFKKWFKSSKVVDESGKPLRVYHGTPVRGITTFDPSRAGSRTDFGNVGVGIYTTPQSWVAKAYAKDPDSRTASDDLEGEVLPLYLAIENPLRVIYDENYKSRIVQAARSIGVTADPDWRGPSPGNRKFSEQFTAKAQEAGYDGVFTTDVDGGIVEAVAFRPEQIKSAIGNNGQFDPANPSILKSESAPKPKTARLTDDQVKSAKADAESRVASHWGRSAVNKLKTRGRVEFITKQEVLDQNLGNKELREDIDTTDGFYDQKSGIAYVIADSNTPISERPGVFVHELFHANGEKFLGSEGFTRLKDAFRKLRTRDKEIDAAYKRAEAVNTVAEHLDEEGIAYLAQEAPKHRLSERLTDEAKLFLNRLGIPLDWLNAHAAAVRKIAALNLKDAGNRGRVARFTKDGVKYQKVFHGTPHRGIEQTGFKLQKVGTGEGAQAYGYGMYFAGNKEIAEHYRKVLAEENMSAETLGFSFDGVEYDKMTAEGHALNLLKNGGKRKAVQTAKEMLADAKAGEPYTKERGKGVDHYQRLYDFVDSFDASKAQQIKHIRDKGQLYHAEIPEDSDLLDWDKPLSEQPEKVRAALLRSVGDLAVDGESFWERDLQALDAFAGGNKKVFTGADLYADIIDALGSRDSRAASEYLNTIGIPGLRYRDGGSRGQGQMSYQDGLPAGFKYEKDQSGVGIKNEKGLWLTTGHRSEADAHRNLFGPRPSHNYVIWDETLLTPEKAQITPYYSKRDKPKPKVTGARPEELIEVRKQISSFRTLIKCLGG